MGENAYWKVAVCCNSFLASNKVRTAQRSVKLAATGRPFSCPLYLCNASLPAVHAWRRAMAADAPAELRDPIYRMRRPGVVSRSIDLPVRPLRLERREEAFHCGVVPTVARAAHAADHAVLGEQLLELLAAVLAATIRVMQQISSRSAPPDRHQHRISDQLRHHARLHRPADHPTRIQPVADPGRTALDVACGGPGGPPQALA